MNEVVTHVEQIARVLSSAAALVSSVGGAVLVIRRLLRGRRRDTSEGARTKGTALVFRPGPSWRR